jgi:hypothetical protein
MKNLLDVPVFNQRTAIIQPDGISIQDLDPSEA